MGELVGPACSHSGPYVPDVLFWSIILFFTTFFLSSFLKQFKTKSYFPTKVSDTLREEAMDCSQTRSSVMFLTCDEDKRFIGSTENITTRFNICAELEV